jgi:hypothetical protein
VTQMRLMRRLVPLTTVHIAQISAAHIRVILARIGADLTISTKVDKHKKPN